MLKPTMVSSNRPPKGEDAAASCSTDERQRKLLDALQSGDLASAREHAEALTRQAPRSGLGWKILGLILYAEGSITDGIAAMRLSLQLLPNDAEAHCNLGFSLGQLQRFEEAEIYLNRAIDIDAGFSLTHYRLGMIKFMQGNLAQAQIHLRRGLALKCNYADQDAQNHSNLLFVLAHDSGVTAASLKAAALRYGEEVEAPLRSRWPEHANHRDPARRLQVGFVYGDLYDDDLKYVLAPVLAGLAAFHDLELHAYSSKRNDDGFSGGLKPLFKNWDYVDTLSDEALASRVISNRIDILVDLSGHNGRNRLPVFARKPAPVQLSGFGYPCTTGVRAIDYYLADPLWLTPGRFDAQFTEKLIYLPDLRAFDPPADGPAVGPLPAIARGHLTFASFHQPCKIDSETIRLWCDVLLALPNAALLLIGIPGRQQSQLVARFAVHGIDPARITPYDVQTMHPHADCHGRVDLALDTLTYSGSATTMRALSMGIPTLTIQGAAPQARISAGILGHLGLEAFIAGDEADFIIRACDWSSRLPELAALRAGLPLRENPAGAPRNIAAHFHQALRRAWRLWCQGLEPCSFQTESPTATPSDTHLAALCAPGVQHELAGGMDAVPTRKLSRAERKRARTAELLAERRKVRADRTAPPVGRGS